MQLSLGLGASLTPIHADAPFELGSWDCPESLDIPLEASGASTWTYDWDYENLMTRASSNGVQQQAYVSDGFGRRVLVWGASATWTASLFAGSNAVPARRLVSDVPG